MKKFTLTIITIFCLQVLFVLPGYAQTTRVVSVGPEGMAEYLDIITALNEAALEMAAGDSLIVFVPAGLKVEPTGNLFVNWAKALHVMIIGEGAGVSVITQGIDTLGTPRTSPPALNGSDIGGRMWQIGSADMNGSTLTFKNLTFRYMGNVVGQSVGSIMNFVNELDFSVTFENIVFDQCVGRSLINHNKDKIDFLFDNCLFTGCIVAPQATNANNIHQGLIHRGFGGNITVKNTTFISNSIVSVLGTENRTGGLIRLSTASGWTTRATLENVVMVNNKYTQESATIRQPMLSFRPQSDNPEVSVFVSMKDVVMAGNLRDEKENDVDLLFEFEEQIIFHEENAGNFMNKAMKYDGTSYASTLLAGASISTDFTYQNLNMLMEGNLPKLTPDEFGIGKITFTSTPVNVENRKGEELGFSVFSSPYHIRVSGLAPGQKLEIFNMMGSRIAAATADNTEMKFELPAGIYIVRSGNFARKVLAY